MFDRRRRQVDEDWPEDAKIDKALKPLRRHTHDGHLPHRGADPQLAREPRQHLPGGMATTSRCGSVDAGDVRACRFANSHARCRPPATSRSTQRRRCTPSSSAVASAAKFSAGIEGLRGVRCSPTRRTLPVKLMLDRFEEHTTTGNRPVVADAGSRRHATRTARSRRGTGAASAAHGLHRPRRQPFAYPSYYMQGRRDAHASTSDIACDTDPAQFDARPRLPAGMVRRRDVPRRARGEGRHVDPLAFRLKQRLRGHDASGPVARSPPRTLRLGEGTRNREERSERALPLTGVGLRERPLGRSSAATVVAARRYGASRAASTRTARVESRNGAQDIGTGLKTVLTDPDRRGTRHPRIERARRSRRATRTDPLGPGLRAAARRRRRSHSRP